ncbi:MAG: methyltransferase domain-containing protein [Pedobacter sp.]|nr:MAG: methyltransferase domain-containing protein [Pedobacter sp.]
MDLHTRSYEKELMDGDQIPFADMAQTLRELNTVNTRLGGHSITIDAVKDLWGDGKTIHICEIGCGGGDNLQAIHNHFKRKNVRVRFTGIDINQECISFAQQQYSELPAEWICSDYKLASFTDKPDIIFSSLFCHHFTDDQIVQMLPWLQQNSARGFFINDLQRNRLAYYLIKYITKFFSKSYLVKNDACLSVARSFRKQEWMQLFRKAGIAAPEIRWRWAFRYLVVSRNANNSNSVR